MDIVLGVSMESSAVRLVLIEGVNADGVTVEEATFEVTDDGAPATSGAPAQVMAALIGTREGAAETGHHLTSTGVTWTDPSRVAALRAELAARDAGSVMLVSPLLAAAALAQTVGYSLDYEYIAMLFVEARSSTLAVVDIGDGSIVDLHRQSLDQGLGEGASDAQLAAMVATLDAPGSRPGGVFVIGCGVDIVPIKPVLEAATSLVVSAPEEPESALARGAALASANAPLFASSTSALAYALDPGTGEMNARALAANYLDVCVGADRGQGSLAYSALADEGDDDAQGRRRPLVLAGSAMVGVAAFAAGLLVVSLTSDVRPAAVAQPSPPQGVVTPAEVPVQPPTQVPQVPATTAPVQLPALSSPPPAAPVEVASPATVVQPPPVVQAPRQTVAKPPPQNMAPVTQPRRAPTPQAPAPTPVQAPAPAVPPPVAEPAPATPAPAMPTQAPMTMYLHLPFVSIPIPINPPPPPPPPEPPPAGPPPEPAP